MDIKFSHKYKKLGIGLGEVCYKLKLLDVVNIRLEEMSPEFLIYDTDEGKFPLPAQGEYMMLIFLKDDCTETQSNLLTTLRRRSESKEKYYRSNIGVWFNVVFV